MEQPKPGGFPVGVFRSVTRDERYLRELANMTPEEKVTWVEKTKEMVQALREAAENCRKTTP